MTHGEGCGESEDAIFDIAVASPSKRNAAANVGDIIAPMIEHAKQVPEFSQAIVSSRHAGAYLEHRTRIFARDQPPVLDSQRLPPKSPLKAFSNREPL